MGKLFAVVVYIEENKTKKKLFFFLFLRLEKRFIVHHTRDFIADFPLAPCPSLFTTNFGDFFFREKITFFDRVNEKERTADVTSITSLPVPR